MDLSLILAAYFLFFLGLGFFFRKVGGEEGFILADRKLSFPVLVATIAATFYGASAVMGTASLAYLFGYAALWFVFPFYFGNMFLLSALPKIRKEEAYTLPDLLGKHYGKETAAAASLILAVLCLVPESIIAGGVILSSATPLDLASSMVLFTFVVVSYTLLGGMKSVSYSDLLQLALMLLAAAVLLPPLSGALQLDPFPSFLSSSAELGAQEILVWSILLFFMPVTSAPLYQRIFSSAPKVDAKKAVISAVLLWVVIDAAVVGAGLYSAGLEVEDPDAALLAAAEDLLSPGVLALFLLGLLSAVMSTADSFLHSGASSLSHDVYRKPGSAAPRAAVVFLGAASLMLALYFQDIVAALIFLLSVWTSGVLLPTLCALYGIRLQDKAALYSIAAGSLSAFLWQFTPLLDIHPLFVGLLFSLSAALIFNRR